MFFKKKVPEFVLSAEQKFLLVAGRVNPTEEEALEAKRLFESVKDWGYIEEYAIGHGLAPILIHNTKYHSFKYNPRLTKIFKQNYLSNLSSYHRRRNQFLEILEKFNNNGIIPILIKGFPLAEFYYENPELRPMADIDFIVTKGELLKVQDILLEMGYDREIGKKKEYINWKHDHQLLAFYDQKTGLSIEPHWEFFAPRFNLQLNTEKYIQETSIKQINGLNIKILNPKEFCNVLLLTIFKGFLEGGIRIGRLNDIRYFENILDTIIDNQATQIKKAYDEIFRTNHFPEAINNSKKLVKYIFGSNTNRVKSKIYFFFKIPILTNIVTIYNWILPPVEIIKQKYKCTNKFTTVLYYSIQPLRFLTLMIKILINWNRK